MNIGILRDFDPEVRKQSAERAKLIRILADHWGYGNSVPRSNLN